MANAVNSNTVYVDSTGDISIGTDKNIKVSYIVVTATGASAVLVLEDNQTTDVKKLDLRVATDGESKIFDFSSKPLVFPNGINVETLTNAIATLVIDRSA